MTLIRLATLVLLLLIVGCGAKKTIVGKWQGNAPLPGGRTANAVMEFKADGTQTTTANAGAVAATVGGHYTVKDETLQITPDTVSFNGRSMPLPAQAAESYTYKLDDDKLILTNPKASLTLTRVKE